MTNTKNKSDLSDVPRDILMNYYNHQYVRMGKLEDSRTTITNITITLSVLALTFGFDKEGEHTDTVKYALMIIMILVNLFAVSYIWVTKSWIETFKLRARGILEMSAHSLFLFDEKTHSKRKKWTLTLWQIQMGLHILLTIGAIGMMLYLSSMSPA